MKQLLTCCIFLASLPLFSQTFQLTVEKGYGSTSASPGDTIHIWAEEWGAARTFDHWSGDTAFLEMPGEWHTRVIMPAHDVTVTANTSLLPAGAANPFSFEQIQGKNILKPVYYYFPQGGLPKLVVWLWHGTGGSAKNWIWKDFEMRQFCNYLIANDVAIIVTESDESTLNTDLDGDGNLRYNYSPDTVDNYDVANVRAIRDTFINRGRMNGQTPQAALGFSAGGAFAVTIATFLNWQAAVSHNSSGSAYIQYTKTPVLLSMTQEDMHPDVGPVGNQEAYDNWQYLLDKGQCAQFFFLRPSPLYPQRFKRIPGIGTAASYALSNELAANGCLGTGGYLVKSPNQIEDMVVANPQNWPNLLSYSDTVRQWLKDELAVMWTSHHYHHDFMAADLAFLLNPCSLLTPTQSVENTEVVSLFPNPANGFVFLPEHTGQVRVFDLNGRTVFEKQISGATELDVSCLPAGLFFVEMATADGKRKVARFVKE